MESSLLREKALDVLALEHDATAVEIKEAYRDLVKVWHPDRFGDDPKLRRKAEEKLQQINEAYRALQSPARPDSSGGTAPRPRYTASRSASNKTAVDRKQKSAGWIGGGLAIVLVLAAAAAALKYGRQQIPAASPIPELHKPESTSDPERVEVSPAKEGRTPVKDTSRSRHQAEAGFRVRELSDAEAAQLEAACPREKMPDPSSYQKCIRAQLDVSGPDLSSLSAEDRAGIESACRQTKSRDGLSAYNRCERRMVKLLKESTQP